SRVLADCVCLVQQDSGHYLTGTTSFSGSEPRDNHLAPVPSSTTGTVRNRIFKSSQNDQLSMYSRSRRTQSRKSVTLFRPLTCHKHVIPGLTLSRRRCARSSKRLTSSTGSGRGPTRLISPRSTLIS